MNQQQRFLIVPLIILVCVTIVPLTLVLQSISSKHTWTNRNRLLSLEDSRPYIEVYINGELLQSVLKDGKLLIQAHEKNQTIGSDSIGVRLNSSLMQSPIPLIMLSINCTIICILLIHLFLPVFLSRIFRGTKYNEH